MVLQAPRASGVAANPNAFALQMSLVACVALVAVKSERLATLTLAIALGAIWFSASRAGNGAIILTLVAAVALLPSRRRVVICAVLATAAVMALFEATLLLRPLLQAHLSNGLALPLTPMAAMASSPNSERWQTIVGGLSLFAAYPLFGAGLGAFAESWRLEHGQVQVIHSTPIWLLAEFGVVGAVLVALPFARIILLSLTNTKEAEPMAILAFLICLVFAVMASAHEMLYQRPFWFLLGATLTLGLRALPSTSHRRL